MTVTIAPAATEEDLEAVLPLVADYQRFYGVEAPDDERNRAFFRRFLAPGDGGLILVARDDGDGRDDTAPLGHATLYWSFSSMLPGEIVVLNDLFVTPDARGRDVGRALIEASAAVARERGVPKLTWQTALDNRRAQRLYERLGTERSAWFEYELRL